MNVISGSALVTQYFCNCVIYVYIGFRERKKELFAAFVLAVQI